MKSYNREPLHSDTKTTAQQKTLPEQKQAHLLSSSHAHAPAQVMQLQKTIGNQAVLQLLRKNVIQPKKNETGMPDTLKSGLESLSGIDLSDVKVHYQSDKPKQIGALAYAQGTDIHLGPGQEHHLPHEGWHVVQQMQGRVKPTLQMQDAGVAVNDEVGLEDEADQMGMKALQQSDQKNDTNDPTQLVAISPPASKPIQGVWIKATVHDTGEEIEISPFDDNLYYDGHELYEVVSQTDDELVVRRYVRDTTPTTTTTTTTTSTTTPTIPPVSVPAPTSSSPSGPSSGPEIPYKSVRFSPYFRAFSHDQKTNMPIKTKIGEVAARYFPKRKSIFVTSKSENFGDVHLGTKYDDIIWGLRNGTNRTDNDHSIAQAILDENEDYFDTNLRKRAYVMLDAIVYLSEEDRRHGAGKISRAAIRLIANKKRTFDDYKKKLFKFAEKAQKGREQIGEIKAHIADPENSKLSADNKEIFEMMSPVQNGDFSSDEGELDDQTESNS